jgi:hypothetical protein
LIPPCGWVASVEKAVNLNVASMHLSFSGPSPLPGLVSFTHTRPTVFSYHSYLSPDMAQKQATRTNQAITLKGSTALVTEFFEYGVNR